MPLLKVRLDILHGGGRKPGLREINWVIGEKGESERGRELPGEAEVVPGISKWCNPCFLSVVCQGSGFHEGPLKCSLTLSMLERS